MKQQTIKLTRAELREIAARAVLQSQKSTAQFYKEVDKQFDLIRQMEMSRPSKLNRNFSNVMLFAGCAFFALALKIFCENYWRLH